jgi:transcriptional regulator GlxA family with amidase domain
MRVAIVLQPGFQLMCFAAVTAFEIANFASRQPLYELTFLSETGGAIASSLGPTLDTQPLGDAGDYDTVIVGGLLAPAPTPQLLIEFMFEAEKNCRRVASICTGAFVLAEAGLLDGRRATTHWAFARDLQSRFPKVRITEDRIFVADGSIWTSAGMTSGVDLALGMIENDHGRDLARVVAQNLVLYHRRAGGQLQHSNLLMLDAKSDRVQNALTYASQNLRSKLTIESLAKVANLSPRQFSRAFRAETGQSPARAVENLRLEAARLMLEQGRHPIDTVAIETGFLGRERMRRAFARAYGQPPQAIRRVARAAAE